MNARHYTAVGLVLVLLVGFGWVNADIDDSQRAGLTYEVVSTVALGAKVQAALPGKGLDPHQLHDAYARELQALLNARDEDGWEFVAINEAVLVFRKPERVK